MLNIFILITVQLFFFSFHITIHLQHLYKQIFQLLISELTKLDQYLGDSGKQFLAADHLTEIDCSILPQLHTIRIAAGALKNFEIPHHLKHLWAYLQRGYNTESFKRSCPYDQVKCSKKKKKCCNFI